MSNMDSVKKVCDVVLHGFEGINAIRVLAFYDAGGIEEDTGDVRKRGVYFDARGGLLGDGSFEFVASFGYVLLVKTVDSYYDRLVSDVVNERHNDLVAELVVDNLKQLSNSDISLYAVDSGHRVEAYSIDCYGLIKSIENHLGNELSFTIGLKTVKGSA